MKNKFLPLVLIIIFQLSLSNCAYIYSQSNNVAETVQNLTKEKKYGLALKTLSYISKDHSNYVYLMSEKKRIEIQAKEYEKKSLHQAAKFSSKKQWAAAMKIYNQAHRNLPDSENIKKARDKFIEKRDKYLNLLKNKLLVSNAKTLRKKTATTKEIAQVNPNDSKAKKLLSSHIREVNLTADKLIVCAEDSLKNNDIQLAEECIALASNLSTSNDNKKKIKRISLRIKNDRKKHSKIIKKSNPKITKKLSQVKNNAELILYKNELDILYQKNKSNKKIIRLKRKLKERINLVLKKGIKQGQELYSQGRIQQALNQWNQLHQLEPSNIKLNDYIDRAQKVLKKLRSLSNNPNVVSPAKVGG